MRYVLLSFAVGLCWLVTSAPADVTSDCLVCHAGALAERRPDGSVRSLHVDGQKFFLSQHGGEGCLGCHGELGLGPHDLAAGRLPAIDEQYAPFLQGLSTSRQIALNNCMGCHKEAAVGYMASDHGQARKAGSEIAPLCDSCHGNHYISSLDDLESPVGIDQQDDTCASCHADQKVMAQVQLGTHVVETYDLHFHGRKRLIGDRRVAVCTSCHAPAENAHTILKPGDPQSTVNPANVDQGCGRAGCHPGVGEKFALSFGHEVPSFQVRPIVFLIGKVHYFLMSLVLGVMFIHIFLDITRRRLNYRRAARAALAAQAAREDEAGGHA